MESQAIDWSKPIELIEGDGSVEVRATPASGGTIEVLVEKPTYALGGVTLTYDAETGECLGVPANNIRNTPAASTPSHDEMWARALEGLAGVYTVDSSEVPAEVQAAYDNSDVAVGDLNSDAPGSGARKNAGKIRFDLVPLHLLAPVARVLEAGSIKYAPWNWAKGMAWMVPIGCIMRHLADYMRGETVDPESGESHMAHIICNCLMLLHYEDSYPQGDDRPAHHFGALGSTSETNT